MELLKWHLKYYAEAVVHRKHDFQTGIGPYPAFKSLIKTKLNFTREDLMSQNLW
jgi:hypothetical protein